MNSLKKVAISDIKQRPYNPASRIAQRNLTTLVKSIERLGLIYPIAVTKSMDLIDGHRRLAACIALGWDSIPVIIVSSEETAEAIYGDINATARKMTGHENLQIWLSEPTAVSTRAAAQFEGFEEHYGRKLLQRVVKERMSCTVFRIAAEVARYVGSEDDRVFGRKTANWVITHRMNRLVRSFMEMKGSPKTLHTAIKNNKDLRLKFTASGT